MRSHTPLLRYDPIWLLVVIAFMWLVRDGVAHRVLVAVGQLCGLYATVAVLLGLVLSSRAPWLERRHSTDRLNQFHRCTGFAAALRVGTRQCAAGLRGLLPYRLSELARTCPVFSGDPSPLAAVVPRVTYRPPELSVVLSVCPTPRRRIRRGGDRGVRDA